MKTVKASYRKPVRITQPGLHTASRSPSGWQSKCSTGKGRLENRKRNSMGRRYNQHQRISFLNCYSSKCTVKVQCVQTADMLVVLILTHSRIGIFYTHSIQTQGFTGVNIAICFSVVEKCFLPALTV